MLNPPLLDGLRAAVIPTSRLRTHIISGGPGDGEPIILLHGNASAARFYEELIVALPTHYHSIAPDMRGYGRSQTLPVDATRGLRDFSDDLHALIERLELRRPHLIGWSLSGPVVMQYAIDHPDNIASITLIAPGSPYGFGGTRDAEGTLTTPDFAGTGAGQAKPEFIMRLKAGDRSADAPLSPRNVMNALYFKPPFRSPREDIFVDEILLTACGPQNYPGNIVPAFRWPGFGPGSRGVNNALSPKYCNLAAFAEIRPQPPVLWIRGDADQIVSDSSLTDVATLGQLGVLPGYPGRNLFPQQPMVSQTRAVLDRYARNGGRYQEVVLVNCGHWPHIEQPAAFRKAFFAFLQDVR